MRSITFRRVYWTSKLRRWRVARLVLVYLVAAMILAGCADSLLLFPSRDVISVQGETRVLVPSEVGDIEIWTLRSAGARHAEPRAFVLAFIGNASRAEYEGAEVAEQWGDRPVEVWAVNYPGFGGSTGKAKLKSIPPAALAAFDALRTKAAGRPIFISAQSIGTTAALHVAAHRPVAGLVLHNPPPLRQLILGNYGWWNLWLAAVPVSTQIPRDLDSLANAGNVHAPAVFLLANNDTVVPPRFQQRVVDAFAGPKKLVRLAGAGHNDGIPAPATMSFQTELDWLWNQAAQPTAP